MSARTDKLMAELRAILEPESADLPARVASAELCVAACMWALDKTINPDRIENIARRLQELPEDDRQRVLDEAPHGLMASPADLPARAEGLRLVLAEVLPRLR
jgi:hypothetical protein